MDQVTKAASLPPVTKRQGKVTRQENLVSLLPVTTWQGRLISWLLEGAVKRHICLSSNPGATSCLN
uniref:Uncharacterized protein n=1 Tax=Arundo donax TaxID=35708 RepID=A0A0A9A9F5_ARUDO